MEKQYPVTMIEANAFSNIKITSVQIPATVIAIDTRAFSDCGSLTEVDIPKSVTELGKEVFLRCYLLKTVDFEKGSKLETLSSQIFSSCSSLESVTLPTSLKTIAAEAFRGCKSLKTIDIPENVTSIGEYVFLGCGNLEKINVTSKTTLPAASESTFDDKTYLKAVLSVQAGVTIIEPWTRFENTDLNGATTEQCATPKIYYDKGTLKFECETEGADIRSTITVSDAITAPKAKQQVLSKKYVITARATHQEKKRSDVKTAYITWMDGKAVELEGFDGVPVREEVDASQQGVPGDMNGDGQVTAEDAALILKKLTGKDDNNNQGE
jgi:hypothetical protein